MKGNLALVSALLCASLAAQSNAIPGLDISVYDVGSPSVYGRIGPAWPNGTAGIVIGHSMSNCGSVHIPWDGEINGVLVDQHPKIAFLLARESGGRMVQISGKSHCKHSRIAFNFTGSPPCQPCQIGPSAHFAIGCYDIYSAGFNASRFYLGPTTEIDPWLGTWDPQGSYFDIGDPQQANFPQPADSIQSLDTSWFDVVKNRMEVPEQELVVGGRFYGQNQVVVGAEPVANRANNQVAREMSFTWSGSAWSGVTVGAATQGSVLERWGGATTAYGGNGSDDGRFLVAVKVTGPVDGMWHYEYALQNVDNHRGGASLRIPVCANARVENVGFRDIDQDPLNDWTINRQGAELQVLATANNPLDWNTFYNVWFDSDAAPVTGAVEVDQARLGPGALFVQVPTTVPGQLGTEYLGAGCGAPAPRLEANGVPSSPNAGYALDLEAGSNRTVVVAFSAQWALTPVGGCDVLLDQNQLITSVIVQTDASGGYTYALPVPPGMSPTNFAVQAFEVVSGGPLYGFLALSNGLKIRAAGVGCP